MGDHESGVDAGVGSACGGEGHRLAEEGPQGRLHALLNADGVGLVLPAVVGGAVIGEEYKCAQCFRSEGVQEFRSSDKCILGVME